MLPSPNWSLSSCVNDSIISILMIGGIICISFIIIELLNNLNVFYPFIYIFAKCGISPEISSSILNGALEMTKGCLSISTCLISLKLKTILSCSIISFGGLSTILQAMSFLKTITTYKLFILQKITHTLFATIICVILSFIFL